MGSTNGKAALTAWELIAAREYERGNYPAAIAAGLLAVVGALRETTVEMEVWGLTEKTLPSEGQDYEESGYPVN